MRKAVFIINPVSGIGGKASLVRYLEHFFHHRNGWAAEICYTKGPGDAYDAALRYKEERSDMVVAVGGDGTVNQVARALVHSPVNMGIIPAGSGNGLARHLKIPLSISKAVELLQTDHVEIIDSGSLNGQPFFCTAGLGFEANLVNRFNAAPLRGFPSYIALSALEYVHYHPEKYKIYIEDRMLEREAFLITFANCAQWGNNIYIAPGASATDGLLDMVIWKKTPAMGIPVMAMRLLAGNIDHSDHIESFRGASFRIEREHEGYVQYDGEHAIMGKELCVEIHPSSLRIITPPSI